MDQNNYNNVQNPNVESSNMVQPNMQGVNQINSMLQYNVPTPQQPVQQYVSNEPQNLSSTPKKNNKKVLIIVLGVLLIVVAVVVTILLLNKDSKKEQNKEEKETNVVDGNVELIESTKKTPEDDLGYKVGDGFFSLNSYDGTYMIDCNGDVILEKEQLNIYNLHAIGDKYFYDSSRDNLYFNNEVIVQIGVVGESPLSYEDNILYYSFLENEEPVINALNLTTKEVLWEVKGNSPSLLTNGIIVSLFGEDNKIQLLSKDGEIIVQEKDNEKIYVTSTDIYFKVINDNKVEVYDFNNKLLSSKTLDNNESFDNSLSAGFFITKYKLTEDEVEYRIYDRNFKIIKTFDFEYQILGYPFPIIVMGTGDFLVKNSASNEKKSIIHSLEDKVIEFDNGGTLTTKEDMAVLADGTVIFYEFTDIRGSFAYISESNTLMNLDNSKSLIFEQDVKLVQSSPNSKYIIVSKNSEEHSENDKIEVYDESLNLIYENKFEYSEHYTFAYDDNHILEEINGEIFLVNVFNSERKKLDVKGSYVANNSCGIVTMDNENYNVYKIN